MVKRRIAIGRFAYYLDMLMLTKNARENGTGHHTVVHEHDADRRHIRARRYTG
jgi:hypothetical protein